MSLPGFDEQNWSRKLQHHSKQLHIGVHWGQIFFIILNLEESLVLQNGLH